MSELNWHKSSYSEGNGEMCITVAETRTVTHIKDSKDWTIPGFVAGNDAWTALVEYAKRAQV